MISTAPKPSRLPNGSSVKEKLQAYSARDPKTGCRIWLRAVDIDGYGRVGSGYGLARSVLTHRVAYESYVGPIPDGMCVCHHCDNPPCIEPSHLFLGTPKDNTDDMVAKNRQAKGVDVGRSKLSEEEVLNIVEYLRGGDSLRDTASRFGVDHSTIFKINKGDLWAHLTGASRSNPIRRASWM